MLIYSQNIMKDNFTHFFTTDYEIEPQYDDFGGDFFLLDDENLESFDDETEVNEDKLYEDVSENEPELVVQEPEKTPSKRGRKPKDKIYFGEEQEQAVVKYIDYSHQIADLTRKCICLTFGWTNEELEEILANGLTLFELLEQTKYAKTNKDKQQKISELNTEITKLQSEKDNIFNEKLKIPFKKMVEAIIRGQELYIPNEEFEYTYYDTLSHLLSKADKYDPEKGKRAYSYYSNICKNYLLGRREKQQKLLIRNPSYDAIDFTFTNDINYSTGTSDKSKHIADEEVKQLSKRIQKMIDNPNEYGMRDNEIKIGKALLSLFENWDYVLSLDDKNSAKLNKSVVLFFLRETTGLDTKGVRDNLKKFKKEFLIIRNKIIS